MTLDASGNKKIKLIGFIIIFILAGLGVAVFFMFAIPPNPYNAYQNERLTLAHYSFPRPQFSPEATLTVSLTNAGTSAVNLADSQYILCWSENEGEGCLSLNVAQDSCLNPSAVAPNVTCQLTFNFSADAIQCNALQCPWQFSFKVRTPDMLFQYTILIGQST